MSWFRLSLRLAAHCAAHPAVTLDLLTVAWRFRSDGWYRRMPFLPLPSMTYVRWRMHTAYGDHETIPPVEDVIRYAHWARRANRDR
jgi:hypothetical protein